MRYEHSLTHNFHFQYLIMSAGSEECVTEMEKETTVDDSGHITRNALLQQRDSSGIVMVDSLHYEAQVNKCKPILWILSQYLSN